MARERLLNGVLSVANLAMAVFFGWLIVEGDDGVPGAVIVAGGIGGFLILGECVWHFVRWLRDPERDPLL